MRIIGYNSRNSTELLLQDETQLGLVRFQSAFLLDLHAQLAVSLSREACDYKLEVRPNAFRIEAEAATEATKTVVPPIRVSHYS